MIDLGFFALIANQLARLLGFIQGFVPNWGLAIILLTLLVRLTLFPLTNLSFASMAKMRRLKPEMERINELYKDDAEKKGAATMELYRKEKINPLAGCLPSLVQLPVWWALYTSLSTNIELYHIPFFGWLVDLSAPDPYYVLPLLLGALMHVQQRLSPTSMDPTQAKMMMYFMPIMITVFMLFLPSGLCLYMLTNSALGIGQMRLNEYRLQKEVEAPKASDPSDDDDDGDEDDAGSEDGSANSQKRRPRRKRRVRRGKA
ncbi:MAG: membrane protein insertase YidC [Sandaracinaceae bacterium]